MTTCPTAFSPLSEQQPAEIRPTSIEVAWPITAGLGVRVLTACRPLHCFGSDVPIVLTSVLEKGETLMGQDRGSKPDHPISPIPDDEFVLSCPFLHYRPTTNP
ncbi:hypothetical protein AVEN_132473-1 [Araneus ventricosus]|uniref:Uncharacterized protein n=1 Tax=Araneus ventricosus TaxID=182803 RepID=A0A4Y2TQ18_ARAVE|nr:hypothetical protein AVEN_132473-1 [Araneus ventricosus]